MHFIIYVLSDVVTSYVACSVSDTFAWVIAGRFPCWWDTQCLCGQQTQLPLVGTWSVRLGVNGWLVLLKYDVNCESNERWFVAVANPDVEVRSCGNVIVRLTVKLYNDFLYIFLLVFLQGTHMWKHDFEN